MTITIQKPTCGRIVWFFESDVFKNPSPAVIDEVGENGRVDLVILGSYDDEMYEMNVPHSLTSKNRTWRYPEITKDFIEVDE